MDLTILGITGKMQLRRAQRFLGLASLNPVFTEVSIKQNGRARLSLEVDLSFRQIEIIEEERKGEDVPFRLNLTILSTWLWGKPQRQITRFSRSVLSVTTPRWGENLSPPHTHV